jgi:hypothetical protein
MEAIDDVKHQEAATALHTSRKNSNKNLEHCKNPRALGCMLDN